MMIGGKISCYLKKEKFYLKRISKNSIWEVQHRKRTYYLLFGFIPLYIKDEYTYQVMPKKNGGEKDEK